MADGGIVTDKSPSPPRMNWSHDNDAGNENSGMTRSLTDHLQHLLSMKPVANANEDGSIRAGDMKTLLIERDEMWRQHERSQLDFMEREHARMVHGLHKEMDRLQTRAAELTRQLAEALTTVDSLSAAGNQNSNERTILLELEQELKVTREEVAKLSEINQRKEETLRIMEQRCADREKEYIEELEQKNRQIEELSVELNHKTALVAQLTTQLHQLRLKEAIEKQRQEQRRQLSEQNWKRRQAMASSTKMDSSCSRSMGPAKVSVQVTAEPVSSSIRSAAQYRSLRRSGTPSGTGSTNSTSRRASSVVLPPLGQGTSAATGIGSKEDQSRRKCSSNTSTVRGQRSSSVTEKGGPSGL